MAQGRLQRAQGWRQAKARSRYCRGMSSRVVFWDFDGTLARRERLWAGALADALRRVDPMCSVRDAELRPHLSSGFPWHDSSVVRPAPSADEWWGELYPVLVRACTSAGVERPIAGRAAFGVRGEFYRLDAWALIDGAREALRMTLEAGYRNVILSNHPPELPILVEELGLGSLVEATITSAAVGAEKPNPEIFAHALRYVGVSSSEGVWMVGDNPIADVEGARTVGIRALLADGDYDDARGMTVLAAAESIARW